MNTIRMLVAAGALCTLAACATQPVADTCSPPLDHRVDQAMADAGERLDNGCAAWFDTYFEQLLTSARDNPDPEHRRAFSDFLVRAADRGTISRRQATEHYNRYFNVRFVSLSGDFNTCSQVCPDQDAVLRAMADELGDKELGLMQVSADAGAYYRADALYKQSQLVLEATCDACAAPGR